MTFGYLLFYQPSTLMQTNSLIIFFIGFNILESLLPTWLTHKTPNSINGTLLGLFYSSQYLGIFTGGVLGGLMLEFANSDLQQILRFGLILLIITPGMYLAYFQTTKQKLFSE